VLYVGLAIELLAATLAFLMAARTRPVQPDGPSASEHPLLRP
jgi:hypothetical protein